MNQFQPLHLQSYPSIWLWTWASLWDSKIGSLPLHLSSCLRYLSSHRHLSWHLHPSSQLHLFASTHPASSAHLPSFCLLQLSFYLAAQPRNICAFGLPEPHAPSSIKAWDSVPYSTQWREEWPDSHHLSRGELEDFASPCPCYLQRSLANQVWFHPQQRDQEHWWQWRYQGGQLPSSGKAYPSDIPNSGCLLFWRALSSRPYRLQMFPDRYRSCTWRRHASLDQRWCSCTHHLWLWRCSCDSSCP